MIHLETLELLRLWTAAGEQTWRSRLNPTSPDMTVLFEYSVSSSSARACNKCARLVWSLQSGVWGLVSC